MRMSLNVIRFAGVEGKKIILFREEDVLVKREKKGKGGWGRGMCEKRT